MVSAATTVWGREAVTDLLAGSGLRFVDRGIHPTKGVSGDWLFAVA